MRTCAILICGGPTWVLTDLRSANLGAPNLGTARLNAARLNEADFQRYPAR